MLVSKENINPNSSLDYRPLSEFPRPNKEISPPSENLKYHPISIPQNTQIIRERPGSARDDHFEFNQNLSQNYDAALIKKKRRPSSKRKHKVNTDNEIKIHKNTSYSHVGAFKAQADPEETESTYSEHTAINLSEQKMVAPVSHPMPIQHNFITTDQYQKLASENNELKETLKSLAQTVKMLVSLIL